MKRDSIAPVPRIIIDFGMVLATGTLCLLTAYWLINKDFAFIYGACFVWTASAAWGVSPSWLKSTFVSLSALLLGLAIAEVVLSFVERGQVQSVREAARYTKGYSQPLRENGGELGYGPYPAREVQSWKTLGNEKLYDVLYTINEDGYRQTPGFRGVEEGKAPIVFFGGSFAFGEGVNDDETLPYFFAAETNWNRPILNLAFIGYGPHQMLRSLELGRLRELGHPSVDIAVYEALPYHASRAAGEAWWDPVGPRYQLDSMGVAQYRGRFSGVPDTFIKVYYRYLQVVEVARRSRVVDRTVNLFFPTNASEPAVNTKLMVEIVTKSAAILEEAYQAELVVLFWDNEMEESTLILEGLAQKNIRTIKVSNIIPLSEQEDYVIPHDSHPTAAANKLIARELIQHLGDLD